MRCQLSGLTFMARHQLAPSSLTCSQVDCLTIKLMLMLLLNEFHFFFFSVLVIKLGMEPGRFDLIHNFWE